jgi:hypothetical protein
MVASVTAEVKVQVDKMEVLAPTIVPLQNDIASLNARSAQLQQDIATMKSQAAANATDKASKDDTVANTTNDIKILKQSIEQKKAEIDPLPGAIEVGINPPSCPQIPPFSNTSSCATFACVGGGHASVLALIAHPYFRL